MSISSSSSPSTESLSSTADQKLVDKQMAGVVEAIMIQSYSLANRGLIPSDAQIAAYIASLDEKVLLQRIRSHQGAASTRALTASDEALLRWARLVGQRGR